MIDEFLDNNGDLSELDFRELTGKSEEILLTSLGRQREGDE